MKRWGAAAAGLVMLVAGSGCGADRSEAYELCEALLTARYGEDGVVDIGDVTEKTTGVLVKVEGSLVYREDRGAGERVNTWFVCQLEMDGDEVAVRDLHVND